MKRFGLFVLLASLVVCASFSAQQGQNAGKTVLRGWLSDEGCAGGRASSDVYTGTNPECAKKGCTKGRELSSSILTTSGC